MEEWLTVEEIADLLKMDGQTVRRWLRAGQLQGINFGGKTGWRVRRDELDRYLNERQGVKIAA